MLQMYFRALPPKPPIYTRKFLRKKSVNTFSHLYTYSLSVCVCTEHTYTHTHTVIQSHPQRRSFTKKLTWRSSNTYVRINIYIYVEERQQGEIFIFEE